MCPFVFTLKKVFGHLNFLRYLFLNLNKYIDYPILCLNIAGWVANSVDPDDMPNSAVSYGSTLYAQACLSKYIW